MTLPLLRAPSWCAGTLGPTPYRGEGVEPRGNRQFFDFLVLHHTP